MKKKYHKHISSHQKFLRLNLREVWRYRDLILLFTRKNFVLTYKQTILGPIWIFLNPIISSVIYAAVFGGIAGIGTDNVPALLFYMCSNAIWVFFSTCVTKNAQAFTANANIFGKVYFPRLTIPVSTVLSAVIQFGIQMIMVFLLLIYHVIRGEVSPNWGCWLLIPFVLLHLGLLGLGFGIIVSSLTTKYRDLNILVGFGVQLWMYATPIVYPMSQLGNSWLKPILMINPVTMPVELFRYALLGQGTVIPGYLVFSILFTLAVAVVGIMIFNRVEKTFMDTV